MRRLLLPLLAVLALGSVAPPASATADVKISRLAGADRYGTAAAIATRRSGAPIIALARGDTFPDALVAANVVARYNATTVLLTEPDRLPQATADALQVLGSSGSGKGTIAVMGDETAVGDAVFARLRDDGWSMQRVAGPTRYETAVAAAYANPEDPTGGAILVSGVDFADALAAGPMTIAEGRVILLTPPGELHPATREAIRNFRDVVIVGGTQAVSAGVEAEVRAIGRPVVRVAGPSRQSTAIAVAERLRTTAAFPMTKVRLARGDAFPDALAAGVDSGAAKAPIVFTESNEQLGEATRAWLAANASTIREIEILGGWSAVGGGAEQQARQAAGGS
jgi:putative cell wall-binding protein